MIDNRPRDTPIRVYSGDDFLLELAFVDDDATAIDISGWSLLLLVQPASGAALTATATPGAIGEIAFSLTAAEMAALTPGAYTWDLRRQDINRTLLAGAFLVSADLAS